MKFNCEKCDTTMEIVEDNHVCPACDHKIALDEAKALFEEGKIVGVVEDEELDEEGNPFAKKDDKKDDKSDDKAEKKDDKSDDKAEKKDDKKADKKDMKGGGDAGDDDEEDMKDESFDIDSLEIDVSEDVGAIFNGEELSEDFQSKAKTIFEAAVKSHVKAQLENVQKVIQASYDKKLVEETERMEADIDTYLESAVTAWKDENQVALEAGVRTEMTENFIVGLKKLFEENYVEIPEDRFDLVDKLSEQVADVTAKLDEEMKKNIKLSKSLAEGVEADITKELAEGLADTDAEKFKGLAENVTFESDEQYRAELTTLKESYFKKGVVKGKGLKEDVDVGDASTEDKAENSVISETLRILNQSQD